MTDDDRTLLASSYLDGQATVDERALVEADRELLAEVERLRQLRALLGDAEPPAISMRERHLAAALDAWDRLPDVERIGAVRDQTPPDVDPAAAAAATTVSAPTPTSLKARRRNRNRNTVLAAAAGLVVVIGAGVVIRGATRTTDDTTSSDAAIEVVGTESPAALPRSEVEDVAADAVEEFADEPASDEAFEPEPEPESAPALEGEAPESDGGQSSTGGPEVAPPDDDQIPLNTPEELADFAALAIDSTVAAENEPTIIDDPGAPSTDGPADDADEGFDVEPCDGIDRVVGPASYQGEPVIVGIDLDQNLAIAHTIRTCIVVASAPLP